MKKIIAIVIVIVVLIGGGYYLYSILHSRQTSSSATENTQSSPTITVVPALGDISQGNSINKLSEFTNASTSETIDFQPVAPFGAQNETLDIYVGQKKVGQVVGIGASVLGFSPNGKYFAFQTRLSSGLYQDQYDVNVIDLTKGLLLDIKPKVQSAQYSSNDIEFINTVPYVDAYQWVNSTTLAITSYILGTDDNEASNTLTYYRVSPKETWQYDFLTDSSSLVQTTP